MPHLVIIIFLFALGACIGSFLNVVVWRVPREESLVKPPSHCPQCEHRLAWYDNLPIVGWIMLRGRCRYCRQPISARYPIVEAFTASLFVLYYVLFFIYNVGPGVYVEVMSPNGISNVVRLKQFHLQLAQDWPIFGLYLYVLCALLASSLIDFDSFTIISKIFWWMAGIAMAFHAYFDTHFGVGPMPGALSDLHPAAAALAAGGGVGLVCSVALSLAGLLPRSFPKGEPLMEIDREELAKEIQRAKREGREMPELPPEYTRRQVRAEISKEMLFLMAPLLLGAVWVALTMRGGSFHDAWTRAMVHGWVRGLLGSLLGALVGGFCIWFTRIAGTIGFGRISMGLGDADLMFGVGAAIGAGPIVVTFFLAPFFGLVLAFYMLLTSKKREIPYGPYLSLAAAFTMLFYCPTADYLRPGLTGLLQMLRGG